jgi:MFS_1 like family
MPSLCQVSCNESPPLRDRPRGEEVFERYLGPGCGSLGPYLAIYLLTVKKWDEASIGLVISIATLAGLLAQTPAAALIDVTRAKRAIVIAAALLVTCASLSLPCYRRSGQSPFRRPLHTLPPLSLRRLLPRSRSAPWD